MHPPGGPAVQRLAESVDPAVLGVSFLATVVTAFLALELASRTLGAGGPPRVRWLLAGGATLGGGFWAMHYLAMVGLRSDLHLTHRLSLVVASLAVAVAGSTLALGVLSRRGGTRAGLVLAASSTAFAIAAMQYVGLAGVQADGRIRWDAGLVAASIAVAVLGAILALSPVALGRDGRPSWGTRRRLGAAVGLGLTAEAVHHLGMAAATVVATPGATRHAVGVGQSAFAALLGLAACVVLLAVTVDAGRQKRRAEAAFDLAAVTKLSREIGRRGDARTTVCETARGLLGGDFVALLEPDAGGALGVRGAHGAIPEVLLAAGAPHVATDEVLWTSSHRFVADLHRAVGADPSAAEHDGPVSALLQPVELDGRAIGVLVIGWRSRVAPPTDRLLAAASLMAAESAVAIERADLVARLTQLALVDGLTGLPNRRAIDEALGATVARAARTGQPVTVAMADVDRFKDYNDRYGHLAGDRLLAGLAAGWRSELRGHDVVGRYGGEEFLLLLPGVGPDAAAGVVERLRHGMPQEITCSFGLATWDGTEDADALVGRADAALYAAKRAGRDRVVMG